MSDNSPSISEEEVHEVFAETAPRGRRERIGHPDRGSYGPTSDTRDPDDLLREPREPDHPEPVDGDDVARAVQRMFR